MTDDADDTTDPTAGTQGATALALLILMGYWCLFELVRGCPRRDEVRAVRDADRDLPGWAVALIFLFAAEVCLLPRAFVRWMWGGP